MIELEIAGFLIDTMGKLLVAYTSIMVHHRFLHEHKIDNAVFKIMRKEQYMGFAGIILILVGSSLELTGKIGL